VTPVVFATSAAAAAVDAVSYITASASMLVAAVDNRSADGRTNPRRPSFNAASRTTAPSVVFPSRPLLNSTSDGHRISWARGVDSGAETYTRATKASLASLVVSLLLLLRRPVGVELTVRRRQLSQRRAAHLSRDDRGIDRHKA